MAGDRKIAAINDPPGESHPWPGNRCAALLLLAMPTLAVAQETYTDWLCQDGQFECLTVKKGDTWDSLFPDSNARDLVQRLNRRNTKLRKGQRIAVPPDPETASLMDYAPFPAHIEFTGKTRVVVNKADLAWGAYDTNGDLVSWGPISAGKGFCEDTVEACETPPGNYLAFRKEGSECASTVYPAGEGGAPMPYCVFFNGGIALHGSPEVPGYHASHGCVRLFVEDAEWLNQIFIEIGRTRVHVVEDASLDGLERERVSRNY